MIFILLGSSIELNFPRLIVTFKPVIIDVGIFGSLREGIYKVLKLLDSCDGGVDGTTLGGPTDWKSDLELSGFYLLR